MFRQCFGWPLGERNFADDGNFTEDDNLTDDCGDPGRG